MFSSCLFTLKLDFFSRPNLIDNFVSAYIQDVYILNFLQINEKIYFYANAFSISIHSNLYFFRSNLIYNLYSYAYIVTNSIVTC